MRHDWAEADYERLFRDHPPTEPYAPTGTELARIAQDIGCSEGAAAAQWDDGRSSLLGHRGATSVALATYLRARGWAR